VIDTEKLLYCMHDRIRLKDMCSLDLLKFGELDLCDNISETARGRDIVAVED